MKGYQISFLAEQDRRIEHKQAMEWLLQVAKELGISGCTVFSGVESFGADGHRLTFSAVDADFDVAAKHTASNVYIPLVTSELPDCGARAIGLPTAILVSVITSSSALLTEPIIAEVKQSFGRKPHGFHHVAAAGCAM